MGVKFAISFFFVFLFLMNAQGQVPKIVIQDGGVNKDSHPRRMLVSPDQKYILTYASNGQHKIWDLKTGRLIKNFQMPIGRTFMRSFVNRTNVFKGPSISYDSKYLIAEKFVDEKFSYVIWDIEKEQIIKEFNSDHTGARVDYSSLAFLPDGMILSHGINRKLNLFQVAVYDIQQDKFKEIFYAPPLEARPSEKKWYASLIAVSADYNYFTIGTTDGRIIVFNASKLKFNQETVLVPERILKIGTYHLTNLCTSPDGKSVLGSDRRESKVFDLASGKMTKSYQHPLDFWEGVSTVNPMYYHAQYTPTCACLVTYNEKENNVKLQNPFNGQLIRQVKASDELRRYVSRYADSDEGFTDDGKYAYQLTDHTNQIVGIDVVNNKLLPKLSLSDLYSITDVVYNDKRNELYIGKMRNDALILELGTGKVKSLKRFTYFGDTLAYADNATDKQEANYTTYRNYLLSKDKKMLFSFDGVASIIHRSAFLWDLETKQPINWWFNLPSDEKGVEVLHIVDSTKKYTQLFDEIEYADLSYMDRAKEKDWRKRVVIKVNNHQNKKARNILPLSQELFTDSLSTWVVGYGYSINKDKLFTATGRGFIFIHDTRTGKLLQKVEAPKPTNSYQSVLFMKMSEDRSKIYLPINRQNSSTIAEFDTRSGKFTREIASHDDAINAFDFIGEQILVTAGKDKIVKFWDLHSGDLRLTMLVNGKEYLMFTSDGYYMASKNGTSFIHYVQGNKVYLAQQFDLKYNRPDKVLAALGTLSPAQLQTYGLAYQRRLKTEAIKYSTVEESQLTSAPKLVLTRLGEVSRDGKLELHLKATDQLSILAKIRIWVNGVPELAYNAMDIWQLKSKSVQRKIFLQLSVGKNIVECAVANDKGTESLHEIIEVINEQPPQKPNLYLVCIGAGKYLNLEQLSYAAKDVRDFYQLFKNKTSFFNRIIVDTLMDKAVTTANFSAVALKLREAKPDDHVYIFFSGHGLKDANQNYFLGTYDIVKSNPSTGISIDRLQDALSSCPSRNKLVLLDACFSGKQDYLKGDRGNGVSNALNHSAKADEVNAFDLMQDVFSDLSNNTNGATIIAATRGNSFAIEVPSLKNSYFTHSVLQAFTTLVADSNGDKQVSVRELQEYLEYDVANISKGSQIPVSRAENSLNNFRVW